MPLTLHSTIADVLRNVDAVIKAAGDGTTVLVGKKYLDTFGTGTPPRILFVPEVKGKAGPPLEIGAREIGSTTHSCNVLIRGAEDGTDVGRFDSAYAIEDRVKNALFASAPGRIKWGDYKDASPLGVDAYGAETAFSFQYTRAVPYDDALMNAAYAAAPSPAQSPTNPDQPNGSTGLSFGINPTLENARPS